MSQTIRDWLLSAFVVLQSADTLWDYVQRLYNWVMP